MPAYNFKSWWADDVELGKKCCTIRPRRKIPTKVGDVLTLYTGQRTPACQLLRKAVCVSVTPIQIESGYVYDERGREYSYEETKELALRDGFLDVDDFFDFFRETYQPEEDCALEMEIIAWPTIDEGKKNDG